MSSQTNINHMFRRQLEDVERESSGILILKHCADDSDIVFKRCKGTIFYHYPDILQVRCLHLVHCLVTVTCTPYRSNFPTINAVYFLK